MVKDKKINILHLISSLEVGGAERLLIDQLNVKNEDIKYTVVVMNDKVNEVLRDELIKTGHNIYFLERKESHKHPKYLFQLLKIIKLNKIDIIHTHNHGSKHWAILCKFFNPRLKIVFTLHSMNIFERYDKIKLFIHKLFVDKNIAISKAVQADALKYGIKKTEVIYNGIDLKKYIPKISKEHAERLVIINIARLTHKIKGQDILIKALRECKDKGMNFTCNFVGGVYEYDNNSLDYLKNLVKESKLEENVNFLGNRNDVTELLSESDIFVLPSREEGLGLAILEAMASKVPVIASNIDGPAELISHNKNGLLFESENHEDLAEQILYLYNNKERMEVLSEEAYKFVQDFDISVMCKNYSKLYERLIKREKDGR